MKHHATTLAIPEVALSLKGQHLQVPAKLPSHSRHSSSSGLNQYSASSSAASSKRGLTSSNSTSIGGAGSINARKSPPHYIPDTKVSRIFFQMRNSVLKRTGVNLISDKSQRLKKKEADTTSSHYGGSEQVRLSTQEDYPSHEESIFTQRKDSFLSRGEHPDHIDHSNLIRRARFRSSVEGGSFILPQTFDCTARRRSRQEAQKNL